MSTVNGLPAHVLLVHLLVVLTPLTAALSVVCALWPAALRRLVWLVLALAVGCVVATPITTEAGEWLEHRVGETPALAAHAALGDTMLYFSIAVLVAAVGLVVVHLRRERGRPLPRVLAGAVSALVIVAAVAATVQVYRIGDSGAQSAWGDVATGGE
ncbi:MAG: hypothetical protein JST91_11235 [Actinobacteria bacterium]|nr:hypothetical protein [Actinomycetota bacterium]